MRRRIFPILTAVWILLFAVVSGVAPAFASVSSITIDGMTATPSDVFGGGSYVWVDSSGNLQNTSFSWLQQAYPSTQFYLNLAFFDGSVASTKLPTGAGSISYPSGWTGATSEPLTNAGIAFVTVGGAGLTATKQNGWFPLMPPAGTASSAFDNPFDNPAATGTTSTTSTSSGTTSTSGTSGCTSIYNSNLYVGNEWNSAGSYNDSITAQNAQDTAGEIVTNSTQTWTSSTAPTFTDLKFEGSLPSTASIQITYYGYSSTGTGAELGTQTVNSSEIGTEIPVTTSGAYGLSFTISDSGNIGGNVYLTDTISTDTQLSCTGQIQYATPPWANGGTTGTSSVGGVSGGTGCSPQSVAPAAPIPAAAPTGIVVTNIQYDSSTGVFTVTGQNLPQLNGQETTPAGAGYNYLNFALYDPTSGVLIGTYGDWNNTYGITVNTDTSTEIQFLDNSLGNLGSDMWELYLSPANTTINLYPPNANYLTGGIDIGTGQFFPPVTQAPTINIESSSSTSVTLNWNSVPGATSYQVFENGSSSALKKGIIGTSTTIGGLTPGQTYYFQVAGANSMLTGPQSNIVELVTPLSPPANLKAANFTPSSFDLTWDAESNAAGYEVFQNGVQIATTTTNSYTVTGQAEGNYSYYVEAIDNCGDITQPSNTVQITLNSSQSPVVSVQASGTQGSSGGVSWTTGSSNPAGTTYQISQNGQPIGTTTGTSMGVSNYDSGSTYAVSAVTPAPTNVVQTPITSGTSGAVSGGTSGATCSGTTITWQPGTGTPVGTVYTVYENGTAIATTTSTSYTGPDCTAGTTYTVTAQAPGYLSSSVLTGSSGSSGSNCGCSCPTPPDWNQITQQIGKEVWSQAPPIPPPPTGSDTIPTSDAPAITAPDVRSGLGTFTAPSFSVPSSYSGAPSFSVPSSNAFTDFTTGYSTISVPTSDSIPFTIGDPNNLPHQAPGTILIPGSGSAVGFTPSNPTLANSSPMPQVAVPSGNMGPSYSGGTALMGTVPAWTDPSSGNPSGPTPTYQGSGISGPSPGAYTGVTPSYSAGVNTGNIPIWSG